MHSCWSQFYSVVLCSCFFHEPSLKCSCSSHFQTKQHNFLTWPMQKLPHRLPLTPSKDSNISVIFGFRCEVCSTLQGHFALPVYLQDFYFPFTPKHFFLDLESSSGCAVRQPTQADDRCPDARDGSGAAEPGRERASLGAAAPPAARPPRGTARAAPRPWGPPLVPAPLASSRALPG